jgi:hypothetical protein
MSKKEEQYNDVDGNTFENELAKIMYRYATEGKPEDLGNDNRKQVRFDNGYE